MLVRVNCGEGHALNQASLCVSNNVEKIELACLSIRRRLSFKASPIVAITKMGREQTIPLHVEHCDLVVWRAPTTRSRFMQNCGTAGCDANCDVDRDAHNRTLPRTCQGFHLVEHLPRVRWRYGII